METLSCGIVFHVIMCSSANIIDAKKTEKKISEKGDRHDLCLPSPQLRKLFFLYWKKVRMEKRRRSGRAESEGAHDACSESHSRMLICIQIVALNGHLLCVPV